MSTLESSLFTSAITVCLFSTGLVGERERRSGRPLPYFIGFLVVEMLVFGFELLTESPGSPLKALWLALWMSTSLLVAPCLWLAVREGVEGVRPRLRTIGRWHGAVVAAGAALTLPLAAVAHLGTGFNNPRLELSRAHALLIHGAMLLCVGIFAVQVPYYLWRCRRLLVSGDGAGGSRGPRARWLQLPLVAVLTTWVMGLLRTLHCILHGPQAVVPVFALMEVGVTVGALYLIVRRYTEQQGRVPIHAHRFVLDGGAATAGLAPAKYAKSRVGPEVRERIRAKLVRATADESILGDSLLNLKTLSLAIREDARHVSQVINQDLDSNFYELMSRSRIAFAKRLLVAFPDESVLEIAMRAGFNSKSTFNAAFRHYTALTPSEYREAQSRAGGAS